ncbi:hypothetical protein [Acidocella sp.]|uniref:hypothetical protein n=1 Tax=Acidocella sp. TaxID=50710 RepID=UPI002623D801|nr:hypothetical protein [Acidocella sp.]
MELPARLSAALRTGLLALAVALLALMLCLVAFGFLVAGFCLWLTAHLGAPAASAITGAALLVLAALIALGGVLLARRSRAAPPETSEAVAGSAALPLLSALLGALVRKSPKAALIGALLLGMLSEFLSPTLPRPARNSRPQASE